MLIEHDEEYINNIDVELEIWKDVKFVVVRYHLELLALYVHLVPELENLQRLQGTILHTMYVVVLTQIEGIAHCVRSHVIMTRP